MQKIFKLFAGLIFALMFVSTTSFSMETRILQFDNPSSPVSFGTVSLGTSVTKELKLLNIGNSDLTVNQVRFHENLEGAYTSDFSGNLVIPAGGFAIVNVTFTPTEEKPYMGLVYVESDRTNTVQDRDHLLTGIGETVVAVTRILQFENPATPLDFGDVSLNTPVTKDLKLMNTGNSPLTINEVRFHENLDGAYVSDFVPNVVIPAGGFTIVHVTFTPTASQPYIGLVYVESDRTNTGDRSLLLSGNGISPVTRILEFEEPSLPFDFGVVALGTPLTKTLKIKNTGNSPLTINQVRFHEKLEGVYTTDFTAPVVIPANGFIMVNIIFNPTMQKIYRGLVYVESDRTNTAQDRSRLLQGAGANLAL